MDKNLSKRDAYREKVAIITSKIYVIQYHINFLNYHFLYKICLGNSQMVNTYM